MSDVKINRVEEKFRLLKLAEEAASEDRAMSAGIFLELAKIVSESPADHQGNIY